MCDTLTALPNSTADGSVLFGKNSDREPNEPLVMLRIPGGARENGKRQKCTYIETEAKETRNEVVLMKPSWMWGAEMGVNAKGLVIGNEAVFTKEKQEKNAALLGMDMLRLALETCDTAFEGAEYIIGLLERYGQGGKAGYTENLRYHNSFLLSDYTEAYVLETAGKRWALKKVEDVYSISNSLTLQDNYDKCSEGEGVRFKERYDDRLYSYASKGEQRHLFTQSRLREKKGALDIESMLGILRSHCGNKKTEDFSAGSMYSICMHAGGIISSQTTGSMAVRLKDESLTLWAANTSLPCVSLYKPYWFIEDTSMFYSQAEEENAVESWKRAEKTRRMLLGGRPSGFEEFLAERNKTEALLLDMAQKSLSDEDKLETMRFAKREEERLYAGLEKTLAHSAVQSKPRGLYYSYYWKKQNKQM